VAENEAYEPDYMRHLAEFTVERGQVKTVEDWRRFSARWFNVASWPQKTDAELAAEQSSLRGPVTIGGRCWSPLFYRHAITREARYEYYATLHGIGDPLRFRHIMDVPRVEGAMWSRECGYCALSTRESGSDTCPGCGRFLVWVFCAD